MSPLSKMKTECDKSLPVWKSWTLLVEEVELPALEFAALICLCRLYRLTTSAGKRLICSKYEKVNHFAGLLAESSSLSSTAPVFFFVQIKSGTEWANRERATGVLWNILNCQEGKLQLGIFGMDHLLIVSLLWLSFSRFLFSHSYLMASGLGMVGHFPNLWCNCHFGVADKSFLQSISCRFAARRACTPLMWLQVVLGVKIPKILSGAIGSKSGAKHSEVAFCRIMHLFARIRATVPLLSQQAEIIVFFGSLICFIAVQKTHCGFTYQWFQTMNWLDKVAGPNTWEDKQATAAPWLVSGGNKTAQLQ